MKKFLFLLFFLTYSFNTSAHMAHYSKFNKIEMEILRNGEIIGYNYYFFTRNGEETIVTNNIKFSVKLFGTTVFQVSLHLLQNALKKSLVLNFILLKKNNAVTPKSNLLKVRIIL